jgi:hypothetical protein
MSTALTYPSNVAKNTVPDEPIVRSEIGTTSGKVKAHRIVENVGSNLLIA